MCVSEAISNVFTNLLDDSLFNNFPSSSCLEIMLSLSVLHAVESRMQHCNIYDDPDKNNLIFFLRNLSSKPDFFNIHINDFCSNLTYDTSLILHNFKFRENLILLGEANLLEPCLTKITSIPFSASDKFSFIDLLYKLNPYLKLFSSSDSTPVEVNTLIANFLLVNHKTSDPISIYDPASGTGSTLMAVCDLFNKKFPDSNVDLYGTELNQILYHLFHLNFLMQEKSKNINNYLKLGSALTNNFYANSKFPYMACNPPRGRGWFSVNRKIKKDPRFDLSGIDVYGNKTSSPVSDYCDSQMLFLQDMISKMRSPELGGSRIASVHNHKSLQSSIFNSTDNVVRVHIVNNDLLESVIKLPNSLSNSKDPLYILILSNNKIAERKNKVQFINLERIPKHYFSSDDLARPLGDNCLTRDQHPSKDSFLSSLLDLYNHIGSKGIYFQGSFIESQLYDKDLFLSYKIKIKLPDRRNVMFNKFLIDSLKFDDFLYPFMSHLYSRFGDSLYIGSIFNLIQEDIKSEIYSYCDNNNCFLLDEHLHLLCSHKFWLDCKFRHDEISILHGFVGDILTDSFVSFKTKINNAINKGSLSISSKNKKFLFDKVGSYSLSANKLYRKVILKEDVIEKLTSKFQCSLEKLSNYGYFADGFDNYRIYSPCESLCFYQSLPWKKDINIYFEEYIKFKFNDAWMDFDESIVVCDLDFFNMHH